MHDVVCSAHFVGNIPSKNPNSPAYIPTLFPNTYKKISINEMQQNDRHDRYKAKQRKCNTATPLTMKINYSNLEINENLVSTNRSHDIGTQVAFDVSDVQCFSFECTFERGNNSVSTFVASISNKMLTNSKKILVDKSCGPISDNTISCLDCQKFHGYESIKHESSLKDLTGTSFKVFNLLLSMMPESSSNSNLNNNNKLLIFLIKLKLGITFSALSVLFNVHRTTISRIFFDTLTILVGKTSAFIFWPKKKTIQETLPEVFKINFPECRCIIDCTEFKVEQPPSVEQRVYMYSRYKSCYTIKILVGITPNGCICFLSKSYGGRSSDSYITNDSGFLKNLEIGDIVLADKGFPGIKTLCDDQKSILVMPPILHNGRFTEEEIINTYSVASVRIHIERLFARLKTYKILNNIKIDFLPHIDDIIKMCCVLTNLQSPIIKQ